MGTLAEALRNASFQPVEAPADINQGVLSEFGKGLNSGTTGMGAGLRAIAGTAGEALGFDEFAQGQYEAAKAAELRAQAEAPRVSSYKNVDGLRDMVHFGAGVLGGSAPSLALGMGAGMAAGTAARALAAGTLAQAPLEAGDVALKQLHDPEAQGMSAGERLLRQGAGGTASAALQAVVPAWAGGKLVGRGVDDAAKMTMKQAALRNAGAIPAEGLFEGGGEVVKQTFANNERDLDWENVKENVVGGMVGGTPMAGAGFVGDTMHGVPGKAVDAARGGFRSIRERLEAGKEVVAEKTPVKVKSAVDDIGEFVSGKYQKAKDMVNRVAAGGTVADPAEFAGMDEAQMSAKLDEDDKTKAQVVKEWGDELLNKTGMTPQRRAEVAEAMKNIADPVAQTVVAKAKAAADKASEIGASIDRALRGVRTGPSTGDVVEGETRVVPDDHLYPDGGWIQNDRLTHALNEENKAQDAKDDSLKGRFNHWVDELKDPEVQAGMQAVDAREEFLQARVAEGMSAIQALQAWKKQGGGKKLSADTTGYQYQVATKMLTELGIKESHPEIFDDYETTLATIDLLGNLTAQMEKSPKIDGSLLMETVSIFGPKAADVVNRLYAKVGSAKPEVRENVYKAITEMAAVADHHQRLLELVTKNVSPEYQNSTRITDMPAVLNALINIERGGLGHLTAAEQTFKNMGVVRAYASAFGDKGMDVRNAIRKYVDSTRASVKYGIDSSKEKAITEDDQAQDNKGEGRVFDADGNELNAEEPAREAMRYGGPIRTTKSGNGVFGVEDGPAINREEAEGLIGGVQKKYGERFTVAFEPIHEGSEYGHVVVREQAGKDDFTDGELAKLKLDAKNHNKSKSRLDVTSADGQKMILDAVKVASYTRNKGQDSFERPGESTKLQRLAEGFKRGVASLTDQMGTTITPQDDLIIGYLDGKAVTWGQAKKVSFETATERTPQRLHDAVASAREDLKSAITDREKSDAKAALRKALDDVEGYEAGREDRNADSQNETMLKTEGRQGVNRDENIHRVAVAGEPNRGRSNMDGTPHWVGDRADTRGALVNLAGELKARSGAGVKALGAKLEALASNNALPDSEIAQLSGALVRESGKPTAKTSEIAAIVNPAYERLKDYKAPTKKVEPAKTESVLAKAIAQRAEYLRNPPADYSPEKARGIIDWATKQLERIDAEKATDAVRQDQLSDYRSDLKRLISDAKRITEADAELERKLGPQGSTPNPKAVAAKKAAFLEKAASGDKDLISELRSSPDAKGLQRAAEALDALGAKELTEGHLEVYDAINERLAELVQNDGTAYGMQTKKYSLEGTNDETPDRIARLISRRAANRAAEFDAVGEHTKIVKSARIISFGPVAEAREWFVRNAAGTHAFIIPESLHDRATEQLAGRPTNQAVAVLGIYAIQHAEYNPRTGAFETFGPDHRTPGSEVLRQLGALGDTGERFAVGVPVSRVEGVPHGDTVNFLAGALAFSKKALGQEKIEVQWERLTGAHIGKKGHGWFSKEGTSPSSDARAREAEVATYLDKVLGKSVKRVWSTFTHAGEFERMKLHDVIRLSVHALGPLGAAYHESLHAFFAQLRDAGANDIIDVLQKAAKQPHVIEQLEKIYANQPAVLKQLKDPEERVAYMYQHWVADPKGFKVSIGARTTMEKVKAFIRGVLGIWSNDQRAVHIMEYFSSGEYAKNIGKPNAVREALMKPGTNNVVEAFKPLVGPLDRLAEATFASGDARLRDTGIEALAKIADMIKLDHRDGSGLDRGFIPAARMESTKRLAKLGDLLAGYDQSQQREALEHLQKQTVPTDAKIFDLVAEIKQTLKETREYMVQSGMKVGNLGPDYFPRVWDVHYMSTHEAEVRAMLEKYVQSGQYKGNVSNLLRDLIGRDGTEYMGETATPGMQHAKRRVLDFITPEDAAPFLRKDLGETLVSYVTQASRRAEWQRRFGVNVSPIPGEYLSRIDELKQEARNQGATDEDMRTLDLYLKGVDGTLGDTMDPGLRRMMGNMIVYQNIRLLPMAAFSMAVDPLGILVRGGTIGESYNAAVRGLKSIVTTLRDNGKPDEIEQLAELMGVVDAASISHVMSDIYTQGMVGGKMRKVNDLFFKYNFVEGINRSMRVGATEAAMRFLAKHADGKADAHSKRWMAELGVQAGDIKWLADKKRIALTVEDGLTPAQEHRVQLAVNQWVDGAVLRPDATDKPIWMNDPHWALISHLKQFVFTFQHVILGRMAHEFRHGNYTPAMALSMYVPTMIMADTLKGLIQGGGDVPEWKRGWGPAEYIGHGVQRAGLFGVGQFGVDALTDLRQGGTGIGALVGPTVEQFGDAVQMLGGRKQFGPMVLDALPANALYKNWFDTSAASSEPMFSA